MSGGAGGSSTAPVGFRGPVHLVCPATSCRNGVNVPPGVTMIAWCVKHATTVGRLAMVPDEREQGGGGR
jgi:hypothetical protein